jgi:hypothetical protein
VENEAEEIESLYASVFECGKVGCMNPVEAVGLA